MSRADPTWVPFADLVVDPEVQSRCDIDEDYCKRLAKDYDWERDRALPVVFRAGPKEYYLAEGFRRRHALQDLRREKGMWCEVRPGTRRDAVLASAGSNGEPLQERTDKDKRRAVGMLLKDAEWSQWSNEQIAKACKVSPWLVADVKKEARRAAEEEDRRREEAERLEREKKVGRPPERISLCDTQSDDAPRKKKKKKNQQKVRYTNRFGGVSEMDTSKIGKTQRRPKSYVSDKVPKEVQDEALRLRGKSQARKLAKTALALGQLHGHDPREVAIRYLDWAFRFERDRATAGEPTGPTE